MTWIKTAVQVEKVSTRILLLKGHKRRALARPTLNVAYRLFLGAVWRGLFSSRKPGSELGSGRDNHKRSESELTLPRGNSNPGNGARATLRNQQSAWASIPCGMYDHRDYCPNLPSIWKKKSKSRRRYRANNTPRLSTWPLLTAIINSSSVGSTCITGLCIVEAP